MSNLEQLGHPPLHIFTKLATDVINTKKRGMSKL